jgi:hypothetical protein
MGLQEPVTGTALLLLFIAMTVKITALLDVPMINLVNIYRRFGGTDCIYIHSYWKSAILSDP